MNSGDVANGGVIGFVDAATQLGSDRASSFMGSACFKASNVDSVDVGSVNLVAAESGETVTLIVRSSEEWARLHPELNLPVLNVSRMMERMETVSVTSLEPLRTLINLRTLNCSDMPSIANLEPLRALISIPSIA